jgi:hypothetical protein
LFVCLCRHLFVFEVISCEGYWRRLGQLGLSLLLLLALTFEDEFLEVNYRSGLWFCLGFVIISDDLAPPALDLLLV